jgi:hypothetical protein
MEQQVPVIRHQAVSQNAHGHKIQALFHDGEEILIMRRFLEKQVAPTADFAVRVFSPS